MLASSWHQDKPDALWVTRGKIGWASKTCVIPVNNAGIAVEVACPEGIEPPTHSLEGCCSIQLSYGQSTQRQKAREGLLLRNGRSGGIRTRDPLLPKQMRYQAALRSDCTHSTL